MNVYKFFCVPLALLAVVGCASTPEIQLGPDARTTADGLHFVDNTIMDEAWFRPDADLTQYGKLLVVNAAVHFADADMDAADVMQKRDEFEQILTEEIADALRQLQGFEITDTAGPGVLLMHAAITNVELVDTSAKPGETIFVRQLGSANLVIDLRDSVTGTSIVLAKDQRAIEKAGERLTEATDPATWDAVRRLARSWGTLLQQRLDELSSYRLGAAG